MTDSPNPLTGRVTPLRFRFHVAMAGVLGIGGDLTRWSAAELAEAAALVEVYKQIRPVVQHGTLFRFPDGCQYTLGERTVLFVWRSGVLAAPVRGLAADAFYRDDEGRVFSGAALMAAGLPVTVDGSALVTLTRTDRR